MSKLHVTQIAGFLEQCLDSKIDLSDYAKHKDPAQRRKAFLTRALATLATAHLTEKPIEEFPSSVTDGQDDGGIDLIYFNGKDKTLYLVQTKWHEDGSGSIQQGDMLKFISGVRKVVDLNIRDLNERVRNKSTDIESAVYDANAKIVLVVAHTGSDSLSTDVYNDLKCYVDQQNDTSEIMTSVILDQQVLHKAVSAGLAGNPIDVDIQLLNWGQVHEPYKAVYGRVFVGDVATWYQTHGAKLFEKNLRQFLPVSTVNQDLVDTLRSNPGKFWYFNNGITAVAKSVEKNYLVEIRPEREFGNVKVCRS